MELISRTSVLECIADYHWNNRGIAMDWTEAIDNIFAEVEQLPIIESRPKGKWIEVETPKGYVQKYQCSNCGDDGGYIDMNFCPECGSDMREEE